MSSLFEHEELDTVLVLLVKLLKHSGELAPTRRDILSQHKAASVVMDTATPLLLQRKTGALAVAHIE